MKDRKTVKKLIIISFIILIVGAILGFGIRTLIITSLAEKNISPESTSGIGGDYSSLIELLGNIFSFYIGIGIFIISAIIVLIIWIVYAIKRFIKRRKDNQQHKL